MSFWGYLTGKMHNDTKYPTGVIRRDLIGLSKKCCNQPETMPTATEYTMTKRTSSFRFLFSSERYSPSKKRHIPILAIVIDLTPEKNP
jgi:hypothetical protein